MTRLFVLNAKPRNPSERGCVPRRADQPQQCGGAMGVKSFHASGDGNALRLVSATQPRSADRLRRAKLFHFFDHEHFNLLPARHEFETELVEKKLFELFL